MLDLTRPETRFAVEVVHQAAGLARQIQQELVTPALSKDDRSPVTVADYAVQALVAEALRRHYPGDPLVAEEHSTPLRQAAGQATLERVTLFLSRLLTGVSPEQVCDWIDHGQGAVARRYWTLDPIDGTKGFLRGDQYAVALALVEEGRVEISVLGCPNLAGGWLVAAARGQGCWKNPLSGEQGAEQLRVSSCRQAAQARVLRSVESAHTNPSGIREVLKWLGVEAEPLRMDSQAKYVLLAAGRGDLLFRLRSPGSPHYQEKIWDHAPGSLIVKEAGGEVTDLKGRQLDFSGGRTLAGVSGILASNGHLHQTALEALAQC